ncbi:hypothetical protein OB955_06360 [Halobacteria archaeon AArc-m2/3/4]|uniref:Uncharacterized protein n=1 Tax=Natronoglomus mannanivorans TaxID=2979990 RepID=A0AAP2YY72_9EURY|nr:hypothetical protein [Halobacteria archaeon AArc-xg1-1]MCU4972358.1 hypothetical protein [Halobacteria archaeon AArc-m2/3/4]
MVDEDLELERDVGQATIVYETADESIEETTVPNEHIAYFQDHWIIKTDEDEEGRDLVRRIPAQRVFHVERTVEEFAEEVKTVRDQVESFAADLRTKIPVGGGSDDEERRARRESESDVGPINIDISEGEESERGDDRRGDDRRDENDDPV